MKEDLGDVVWFELNKGLQDCLGQSAVYTWNGYVCASSEDCYMACQRYFDGKTYCLYPSWNNDARTQWMKTLNVMDLKAD